MKKITASLLAITILLGGTNSALAQQQPSFYNAPTPKTVVFVGTPPDARYRDCRHQRNAGQETWVCPLDRVDHDYRPKSARSRTDAPVCDTIRSPSGREYTQCN